MTSAVLVELLTEELPPKSLPSFAIFADAIIDGLKSAGLVHEVSDARRFATPRRLGVLVPGVAARQPDRREHLKGPRVSAFYDSSGAPVQAVMLGFARKCGVDVDRLLQNLTRVDDPKGAYVVFEVERTGRPLEEMLESIVGDALARIPAPKLMRWGSGDAQFVRPVHGLVMMHGGRVIPGRVLGLHSGNRTRGHRFMGSGELTVRDAESYEAQLETEGKVVAGFERRRARIREMLLCAAGEATLAADEALLDEVTGLVEFPAVYEGQFDPRFLAVPQECLMLSMRQHQKYFPLTEASGKLLARFLVVSNVQSSDPHDIVAGNERVLRARLSDAKFFYDQDRKTRLDQRVSGLARVIYHNLLGTQLERVQRLELIAEFVAARTGQNVEQARLAAHVAKADLLTGMVGEFPELQGLMGKYYAAHDGFPAAVCDALAIQYVNRLDPSCWTENPIGAVLYLADRTETLVGIWGIGLLPTGEKDPYGLRRAALGTIGVFEAMGSSLKRSGNSGGLSLTELLEFAAGTFVHGKLSATVVSDLIGFIFERYRNQLQGMYERPAIDAVIALRPPLDEVVARIRAVTEFKSLPESDALAAANKRIANILRKSGGAPGATIRSLLREPAEISLHEAMCALAPGIDTLMAERDYAGALKALAGLRAPVDRFFDDVLVNAEEPDIRANRLSLLGELALLMGRVADISRLAA